MKEPQDLKPDTLSLHAGQDRIKNMELALHRSIKRPLLSLKTPSQRLGFLMLRERVTYIQE